MKLNTVPRQRFKCLYFFMFAAYGVWSPYAPVYYEKLSLSKVDIGILSMLPNICSFSCGPIWSVLGDRFRAHGEVMMFTLLLSTVLTIATYFCRSYVHLLVVVLFTSIVRAPVTSLVDSLVIESLLDKTQYGSMRLWGAISFGLLSFVGGVITSAAESGSSIGRDEGIATFRFIFFLYALTSVSAAFVLLDIIRSSSYRLIHSHNHQHEEQEPPTAAAAASPSIANVEEGEGGDEIKLSMSDDVDTDTDTDFDTGIILDGEEDHKRVDISVLSSIFHEHPSLLVFVTVVFLSGIGSGVIDTFLFLRLKQLGGTGLVMGISRAITCAAEVPCFQVAGYLLKRYGTWPVMVSTQLAYFIRFTYYSYLTEPWAVLPCEVLHGFTFAVMWSAACTYANEISPKDTHATMQALLEGLHWGLGSGLGALFGGLAYDAFGAVVLFEVSALMSLFSLALSVLACFFCPHYYKQQTSSLSSHMMDDMSVPAISAAGVVGNTDGGLVL